MEALFLWDKGMRTRLPPRTPATCRGQLFQPRRERWRTIYFPKRPSGTVYFDVKWTKQRIWSKCQALMDYRNALPHLFLYRVNKKKFPADWRSKVLEGAHIRYVLPVLMSHSAQVETEKTVRIILYMWWICWCPSVNTCPGVMAPPCSTASRQLRAEVRTAAAMRPACHTRLGSRMSLRNLSESSWKHLGWRTGRGEKDTISQQEYRENICFKYNTAIGQHRNISDDKCNMTCSITAIPSISWTVLHSLS